MSRMSRDQFEQKLSVLQDDIAALHRWVQDSGARVLILFEGRDAAGKGGAINCFTNVLNPRTCHVVALPKPTDRERGQWYFQRYMQHLPAAGEMVLFDRSWYNRAGVERVMGFCTEQEYFRFLSDAPALERLLVADGVHLLKYWFAVDQKEQEKRFRKRQEDPLKRWKLSPVDLAARERYSDYSAAREEMFRHTHTPESPWFLVDCNDQRRGRLSMVAHVLSRLPWRMAPADPPPLPKLPKDSLGVDVHKGPVSWVPQV